MIRRDLQQTSAPVLLDRSITCDLEQATRREWLLTNGRGSYAAGTVSGALTRRYHGLLIASLEPPVRRTLFAAKFDDRVRYRRGDFCLSTDRWADGTIEPRGYLHIDRFWLDGCTPVWWFTLGDALLERRIWMVHGEDATVVQYTLLHASEPIALSIDAMVSARDHHDLTPPQARLPEIRSEADGVSLHPEALPPLYVRSDVGRSVLGGERYHSYLLSVERERGFAHVDCHLRAARFEAVLQEGQSMTLLCTLRADLRPGDDAASERLVRERERALIAAAPLASAGSPEIDQLVLAADQFVVQRVNGDHTVIAGYPWFTDWGRDTMISLPGLLLATGRAEIAKGVLRSYVESLEEGLLPNRSLDGGSGAEQGTVDAALWLVEAVRSTVEATGDLALAGELFPALESLVGWHVRGTRFGIGCDPSDGLLRSGAPGMALTWMDARIARVPATPRDGKAVEINALWYNALCVMVSLARSLGRDPSPYLSLAERAGNSFQRFFSAELGYCYDVLDGPRGDDPSLRPNQIFAVSLPHRALPVEQQRAIFEVVRRELLTPYGLRSLAPSDERYVSAYAGPPDVRDAAYHQGTAWGWLMGPYLSALIALSGDRALAFAHLRSLISSMRGPTLGQIGEIFDPEPPFVPRGCTAQAWSVAAVLQALSISAG